MSAAENEGYGLLFGCVSGGDYGAMGLHFVNFPLVADGKIEAAKPEIVLYEPTSNGRAADHRRGLSGASGRLGPDPHERA